MIRTLLAGIAGLILAATSANAQTCMAPSNGSTADAGLLNMYLNCEFAPLTTPNFIGNVGIGTSGAGDQLEVNRGNPANDNGGILVTNTNTSGYGGRLSFATNNGTTTATNSWMYGEAQGTSGGLIGFSTRSSSGTPTIGMRLYLGNTIEFSTGYNSCSGFTTNSTGVLSCTVSDERLKEQIKPLSNIWKHSALSAIKTLTPISFYWKDKKRRGDAEQYGFVAQQVHAVFPNLISKSSPSPDTPDGALALNYDGLIAPIVLALQELDSRVNSLETETFAHSVKNDQQRTDARAIKELQIKNGEQAAEILILKTQLKGQDRRLVLLEAGQSVRSSLNSSSRRQAASNRKNMDDPSPSVKSGGDNNQE